MEETKENKRCSVECLFRSMRKDKWIIFLGILLAVSCRDTEQKVVGIQPYDDFDPGLISDLSTAIQEVYGFRAIVLPSRPLPSSAFVQVKSPRYRADSLLAIQRRSQPDSVDYIIGLTEKDISAAKYGKDRKPLQPSAKYKDWGVFGLGYRPGTSSVVSIYRYSNADRALLRNRFLKIAVHELGHNLGLPHCETSSCVMNDAAETIRTVDRVSRDLCAACRKSI